MKVIIAGSRTITDYDVVVDAILHSGFKITEVVSGCAQGVDSLGERYAKQNHIRITQFPADWSRYGGAAGMIRNGQMADYAEALIAVHTGTSRGTLNMIKEAQTRGLHIYSSLVPK